MVVDTTLDTTVALNKLNKAVVVVVAVVAVVVNVVGDVLELDNEMTSITRTVFVI
jgi:hypothetical protein